MISQTLIKLLLVQYFIIMSITLYEQKWVMAIYWLGATILNTAILLMGTK